MTACEGWDHLLLGAGDLLHAERDKFVELPALLLLALILHKRAHQHLHSN